MSAEIEQQAAQAHIADYYNFLLHNRPYRYLICGELIDQLGQWGNYIATLSLADRLGKGTYGGTLVALVVVVRNLPSLFLFPVAGVVADRYPRIKVLVTTNILSAAIVCGLTAVRTPATLWLMFALLTALFGVGAFFDPARRAVTQELVADSQLPLAATLDSMVWSVMAAVGASLGGLLVSKLGTTTCFLLDAVTYLVAAVCYGAVQWQPSPSYQAASGQSMPQLPDPETGTKLMPFEVLRQRPEGGSSSSQDIKAFISADAPHLDTDDRPESALPLAKGCKKSYSPRDRRHSCDSWHPSSVAADEKAIVHVSSPKEGGKPAAALAADAWQQGKQDLLQGWRYMRSPENRDVPALLLIKASGCLLWGSSDVLYVKFTEGARFQLRDAAFTMGLLFAGMGIGAFVGPLIFNRITPPRAPELLRSTAVAFGTLAVGYSLMTVAPSMSLLFPSVVMRSLGSAVLWVYSTLLLQFRVPNAIQGRVFALEMALYVAAESASGMAGGVMFDWGLMTTRSVSGLMSILSFLGTVVWAAYAWRHRNRGINGKSNTQRAADVNQHDADDSAHEVPAVVRNGGANAPKKNLI